MNTMKGIHKPAQDADPDWLENKADTPTKQKFKKFFDWCTKNGV